MSALILMHGLPATGKSALAAELAQRIGAEVLSADEVRPLVFPEVLNLPLNSKGETVLTTLRRYQADHPQARLNLQQILRPLREAGYPIPDDLDRETYRQREDVQIFTLAEAERITQKGRNVIIDATNIEHQATATDGRVYGRAVYHKIARRYNAGFYIVSLHCQDDAVIRARLALRVGREDEASPARTFEIVEGLRRIAARDENRFREEEIARLITIEIETGKICTPLPSNDPIVKHVQSAWEHVNQRFSST